MGHIADQIQAAHQNAINKGWWEEKRTFGEIIALIQSEVAEALEDYRNGRDVTEVWYENKKLKTRLDDPITTDCKPCGIPSELADIIIRIYDCCGRYGWSRKYEELFKKMEQWNLMPEWVEKKLPFAENLTRINRHLSEAYFYRVNDALKHLVAAAIDTYRLAGFYGIELDQAISEKMSYNATRPQRHGGKVL